MNEIWNTQTNEELCIEYQQTLNNDLYEYFLSRNTGLIMKYISPIIAKHPEQKEDLIQAGKIAIWEAMRRFDIEKGIKFSTYCYFYLKKNMWHNRHEEMLVKVPINLMNHMDEVKEKVPYAVTDTISMNTQVAYGDNTDGEMTIENMIASPDQSPLDIVMTKDNLEYLIKLAEDCLSPRQLQCLKLYYGLDGDEPKTLQQIGDMFNVTRERIRQILEKTLHILRAYCKKRKVDDEEQYA